MFPESIKVAKVVPIFKSGSSQDINNYRPISLLSVFSRIIVHQILYLLQENDIIYKSQYGFQKNKSTLHSLVQIGEKIRNAIEDKMYGCGIFIDLKMGFDTVNHTIFLNKLEYYGIRGSGLKWFTCYLSNRSQYVSINNTTSDTKQYHLWSSSRVST